MSLTLLSLRCERSTLLWMIFFLSLSMHGLGQVFSFYRSYQAVLEPVQEILEGCVSSVPKVSHTVAQFNFDTQLGTLKISWWKQPPHLEPGDCWRLALKIKPLNSFKNPGVQDPAFAQRLQGLVGQGYVVLSSKPEFLGTSWFYPILRWRAQLLNHIKPLIPTAHQGIILDLIVGVRSDVEYDDWQVLRKTGTSHLMAISGLHLGLVALLCIWLFRVLVSLYPPWLERILVPRWGKIFGCGCATFYAFLAGFSVSTQRSLVMLYAWTAVECKGRTYTSWQILRFALLLVLLWDPLNIFAAGAWLSFGAVAWLIFLGGSRSGGKKKNRSRIEKLMDWLYPQLVLGLGLLPLSLFFFSQATWVGLVSNSFAIPWVGWIIVPFSILSVVLSFFSTTAASVFFDFASWNLEQLMAALSWLATWPGAGSFWPTPIWWSIPLSVIGILWLIAPKGIPGRPLGVVLLLPLLFYHPKPPAMGVFNLTVLDVGQGLSVVVRTHGHTVVYDTGTGPSMGFDAGARIVLPYLLGQGIHQIDVLVISHIDQDHSGGAASLLAAMPVTEIHSSDLSFHERSKLCHEQAPFELDQVRFEYFALPASTKTNNSSCVLKISSPVTSVLLPGDIEKSAERYLVEHYGAALQSNILVLPHHGSKTSSTALFIQAVRPSMGIIASGRWNRFHFPHKPVERRYAEFGIPLKNTANDGALSVE